MPRLFPYEAGLSLLCVTAILATIVLLYSIYKCIRCTSKCREYEPVP